MLIKIIKKSRLKFKNYNFKCAIGKNGIKESKIEDDKSTPRGKFEFGKLYYRNDRIKKINTNLVKKKIRKNMGWCNLSNDKNYNKEIKIKKKKNHEKLYRNDNKYDALIVIKYNINPIIKKRGSAIFVHLTKNYKPTAGCIALKLNDFIILAKSINKKDKILIS